MNKPIHKKICVCATITLVILIFLFYFLGLYDFFPLTRWEAMRIVRNGGTSEEISLSIIYLGNHSKAIESAEYVTYIIQYIDSCEPGVYGMNRSYFYKFPTNLTENANFALEKLTGLDFAYDSEEACVHTDDPKNEEAIQAWKDWYENDYEEWKYNHFVERFISEEVSDKTTQ